MTKMKLNTHPSSPRVIPSIPKTMSLSKTTRAAATPFLRTATSSTGPQSMSQTDPFDWNMDPDPAHNRPTYEFSDLKHALSHLAQMLKSQPLPSTYHFNRLFTSLSKMNHHSTLLSLSARVHLLGVSPDLCTLNILLDAICRVPSGPAFGFSLLGRLFKLGFNPNAVTFTSLINGFVLEGNLGDAVKVFDEMSERGFEPNLFTYTVVLKGFCKRGEIGAGIELVRKMEEKGCAPDLVAYRILIKELIVSGRVAEGVTLFREVIGKGFRVDVVSCSIVINALCEIGRSDLALELLECCEPDNVAYTNVINGLRKDGEVVKAMSVFSEMRGRGVSPIARTYTCLMCGLCKLGNVEEARRLLNEMESENFMPKVFVYNLFVDALCKKGLVSEAQNVVLRMTQKGVEPNVVTYNALVDGYCSKRQMGNALKVFNEMVASVPTIVTYNTLINGYCKQKRIDEAVELFQRMRGKSLVPDVITYNSIIGGLCHVGRLEDALEYFKEMQQLGITPDHITHLVLLHGFCEDGHLDEALALFKEMKDIGMHPDAAIFNVLIRVYCKVGALKVAKGLLSSIFFRNRGSIDVKMYTTMIDELCRGGLVDEANELFSKMKRDNCLLEDSSYNSLIQGYLEKNDTSRAMELIEEMGKSGLIVDASSALKAVYLIANI